MTPTYPNVAFLGLGLMGSGMARRLLDAGFPLSVYNRTASRADALVAGGARLARTPREAVEGAGVILSMVADDAASRGVWFGKNGALAGIAPGAVMIECSTVSPEWIRALARAGADAGGELIDAPVTGSRAQAADGELRFLVGGSPETLEKARPVLAIMGKTIEHVGPTGSGALLKLINNFLCGVQTASMAEALAMIERSGLNRDRALEVLMSGAPASPMIKTVLPRMTGSNFVPNFHLSLMIKDLEYARSEGKAQGIDLKTIEGALARFREAAAAGHGEQDAAAVVEPIRDA